MKTRVLLLEDNPAQSALLSAYLEKEVYDVVLAETIREFKELITTAAPDLVLLDLNLPDGDGLELIDTIQRVHKIPLIIITSRDTIMDRVTGLERGADDYICKPYHPRELMIRLGKILNNKREKAPKVPEQKRFGNYCQDREQHRFFDGRGKDIILTPGEYHVMNALLEGEGRVLSRGKLLEAAFRREEYPVDRTIDVLISRLRKKFPASPGEPEIIETVTGFGYRISKAVLK